MVPGHLQGAVQPPACACRTQTGWYELFGQLSIGRYQALVVDAASPGYLRTVCQYVHRKEAFQKELLAQVEEKRGASHSGAELQESATAKGERLVAEGPGKLGWTEADLCARRKGQRAKVRLAVKLRAETPTTLQWIAGRLHMGRGASWSNLLWAERRERR